MSTDWHQALQGGSPGKQQRRASRFAGSSLLFKDRSGVKVRVGPPRARMRTRA